LLMVRCLFFNFERPFHFGCCSLAQEMNFVVHYLPYFRQWLITCPLSALLPFQHLFNESLCRDHFLAYPPSLVHFQGFCPICCVLVFSLFFIQFGFFL
jgi:hypothetical protein